MLSVKGLHKTYPKKKEKVKAVSDVSFSLKEGELVGLLGPNGAGKTTIVKMICGLIYPDQGEITAVGYNPWKNRRQTLKNLSAVLEGNRNVYWPLTVWENMEFFAALKGIYPRRVRERIKSLLQMLDLEEKADVTARSLSRGMQQKLALAVALVSDTPLLILDEPTLGLDVESALEIRQMLKDIVKEEGKTVLLTTHDMHLVKAICPRVIIINEGRIVTDDIVDNLLRLFQVKSYKFNVLGTLTSEQEGELARLDQVSVIENGEDKTIIDVSLEEPDRFYMVTDILRRENLLVDSIEKQEVDFEEVFLQIVGRGKGE